MGILKILILGYLETFFWGGRVYKRKVKIQKDGDLCFLIRALLEPKNVKNVKTLICALCVDSKKCYNSKVL